MSLYISHEIQVSVILDNSERTSVTTSLRTTIDVYYDYVATFSVTVFDCMYSPSLSSNTESESEKEEQSRMMFTTVLRSRPAKQPENRRLG